MLYLTAALRPVPKTLHDWVLAGCASLVDEEGSGAGCIEFRCSRMVTHEGVLARRKVKAGVGVSSFHQGAESM